MPRTVPPKLRIRNILSVPNRTGVPSAAKDFIYAGSSAALLLTIGLVPALWFLSFLALLPLFYRLSTVAAGEAIRVGFFFGLAYFLIGQIDNLAIFPWPTGLRIAGGISLCAITAGFLSAVRARYGHNPLFPSLVWIGLQAALEPLGLGRTFFGDIALSMPLLHSFSILFGFIIASLIIIFVNFLILAAVDEALAGPINTEYGRSGNQPIWQVRPEPVIRTLYIVFPSTGRAPPIYRSFYVFQNVMFH